jgi:hypothetical protein
MGLLWRAFAPRPLKRARRAMHPSWVIEDAIVRGLRGRRRRRRRSRPAQPSWQGKGEAFTPDGTRVTFQCGHHHRSQRAALECMARRRRQIEHGQNMHLVTRVLDTPESRQRAAELAEQQAARKRELAAQRREAARQRAERRQAARQARAERTAARREAARRLADKRRAHRAARPPLSWPGWGNISAGAAAFTGLVLAGVAGDDKNTPLAVVAVLLLIASVGLAAMCVPVVVLRKIQARKRAR